ncbi:MAG: ABC transporter permease [Rubripirellula sp.]
MSQAEHVQMGITESWLKLDTPIPVAQTLNNGAVELPLSWFEVGIAAALLSINMLVSVCLQLGIARQLVTSSLRMTIQLALIGLVLKQIFSIAMLAPVLILAGTMTVIAGVAAVKRINTRYQSIYSTAIFSIWISSWLVTGITLLTIVRPDPWYQPSILIPLLGMVLGNSLTGISLGLERFLSELVKDKATIETLLCLGATRWESCRPSMVQAAKAALIPILNTMSVAGIVSIPGMMTGQLLAGAAPMQAVNYQIMIMFVIAAAIALGTVSALTITYLKVTSPEHRVHWANLHSRDR